MEDYIKLTKKNKFIGAQPVTLNINSFTRKYSKFDYYITNKLDGKRYLIFIDNNGNSFKITSKMEFTKIKLPKHVSKLKNTVLDSEYFNKKFHVFDVLYFKDKSLLEENFTKRLSELEEILDIIKSKKLIKKEQKIIYSDQLCKKTIEYVENIKHRFKEGDLDGIILTPDSVYYSQIFKYKPLELLSIDFKIKKEDGKFKLLLQNGDLFVPRNFKYKDIGIVEVSKHIYNKYPDNSVVEFVFKEGKFIPLRIRKDKINSNALFVILDNFKTIINQKNNNLKSILCQY